MFILFGFLSWQASYGNLSLCLNDPAVVQEQIRSTFASSLSRNSKFSADSNRQIAENILSEVARLKKSRAAIVVNSLQLIVAVGSFVLAFGLLSGRSWALVTAGPLAAVSAFVMLGRIFIRSDISFALIARGAADTSLKPFMDPIFMFLDLLTTGSKILLVLFYAIAASVYIKAGRMRLS